MPNRGTGRGKIGSKAVPYDVVVVGGGPAGAVISWALARRGFRVAVLEREHFPREKVCGDFVEPRGLKIFEQMECGPALRATSLLPVTHVAMFLQAQCAYRGRIPFYAHNANLPPHGYIVPREQLDEALLNSAKRAGATVFEACAATGVAREGRHMRVSVRNKADPLSFYARLVVGADGVRSTVARSVGLLCDDSRYTAVSQRAYVGGVSTDRGEAAFFFDDDLFPGYGWMFPMSGGRANVGVGILSETRDRCKVAVPQLFQNFIEKLRRLHPECARIRLLSRPIGGIVKTYGSAGPNHFDGGILVGDAGCFVDPITGEGITPAAESALLAAPTIVAALEKGEVGAQSLSQFERDFRRYFDPAMQYLDFCAAVMRNRHLREFWLTAARRGCEKAATDPEFARAAGSAFGGMEVLSSSIFGHIFIKVIEDICTEGTDVALDLLRGKVRMPMSWTRGITSWTRGWWQSALHDPFWHYSWSVDVLKKWTRVSSAMRLQTDPRAHGPSSFF